MGRAPRARERRVGTRIGSKGVFGMSDEFEFGSSENGFAGTATELPPQLPLEITVDDRETIAALCQFAEGEDRERFALQALRIGVLAMRQARGEIDGEQIRRESAVLLKTLETRLTAHAQQVQERLSAGLGEYFDPKSGRFHERVERLIGKDGEIEEVLRRQVGGDGSELVRTLSSHFGTESPLMKLLSPTESAGLMQSLSDLLGEQLQQQRERILEQFSLNNKEGALSRLVGELTDSQGKLTENFEKRIDDVVREFSLDEENSALSRLVRNVERAQKTITSEFSLDDETSALSRLKVLLESTQHAIDSNLTLDDDDSSLARLRKQLTELLEKQSDTNQKFQAEVRLTLEKMSVQRKEAERSTRHGIAFEEVLAEFLSIESQHTGDILTRTGNTTGAIKGSKKGDCVIALGPESVAAGAQIVVEAKEKESYQLAKARDELLEARKNRGAQVGIFVYSAAYAPREVADPKLVRFGEDIFVIWDPEDPASDLYVRTALTLARALCVRGSQVSAAQAADFSAIDGAILDIEKCWTKLAEIEDSAKSIEKHCDTILNRVRIDRRSLEKQVSILREKTADLKELLPETPNRA
jgi:hypothetical protein